MRFLSALIIICSLNNLQYYLPDIGVVSQEFMWKTVYVPFASLAPALIYFYIATYLNRKYVISRKRKLLYVPFAVFLLITFIYKGAHALGPQTEEFNNLFLVLSNLHEVVAFFFLATVLILSLKRILKHQKNVLSDPHVRVKPRLNWLNNTLYILLLITIIYGYLMYRVITNPEKFISFYLLWISNSFLIYWLGHIGIYKYGIREERKQIRSFSENQKSYSISEKIKNTHIISLEKLLIEDKQFLNPKTSLEGLAGQLNISKTHLSRLINAELNTSFSDYMNQLRVQEAKKYLMHPGFSNYTLVAIGLEAGFNSKTTFNTAFKKFTGVTPSTYRKQHN